MSKEVEWGQIYGEGDVVCTCDYCGNTARFPFDDSSPSFKDAQTRLMAMGWTSCKVNDQWRDFCHELCRNKYIKKNT